MYILISKPTYNLDIQTVQPKYTFHGSHFENDQYSHFDIYSNITLLVHYFF